MIRFRRSRYGLLRRLGTAIVLIVTLSAYVAGSDPPTPADPAVDIVKAHCLDCHDTQTRKGDLDLSAIGTAKMTTEPAFWRQMLSMVEAGDMPPAKKSTLAKDQRSVLVNWLRHQVEVHDHCDCAAPPAAWTANEVAGAPGTRRMSRFEWQCAVEDLIGLPVPDQALDLLPADMAGFEGFNTSGDVLRLDISQVEAYVTAADQATRVLIPPVVAKNAKPPRDPASIAAAKAREQLGFLAAAASARDRISTFAQRAYRRPATPAEIDALMALHGRELASGGNQASALRVAMMGALTAPPFLLIAPPARPASALAEPYDGPGLAARLGAFLWSSVPDDALNQAAASGLLATEDGLRTHLRRLLADPRAARMSGSFATQWLAMGDVGVGTFPQVKLLSGVYPYTQITSERYGDILRDQASRFVDAILRSDVSLLRLIDADFTFVNVHTAGFYPGVEVPTEVRERWKQKGNLEFVRVAVADANRRGILALPGLLIALSNPEDTNPFRRGKWIYSTLLGQTIPKPPPNASNVDEAIKKQAKTLREKLEQHRKRPECFACHARFDHYGLTLENFDPAGRWREQEIVSNKKTAPVDSVAVLPDGSRIEGISGLKARLLGPDRDLFLRSLVTRFCGFALGRSLTRRDRCLVDAILKTADSDGIRADRMIEMIVLSPQFRYRITTP